MNFCLFFGFPFSTALPPSAPASLAVDCAATAAPSPGTGGESIWGEPFEDEVYDKRLTHEGRGVVAMANSGPKTNGSQFYMTYKSCKHLDGKHTIFGKVVGGLETLIKMERLKTDDGDRPLEPVRLHKTEVFADPYVAAEEAVQAQLRKERGVWAAVAAAWAAQGGF